MDSTTGIFNDFTKSLDIPLTFISDSKNTYLADLVLMAASEYIKYIMKNHKIRIWIEFKSDQNRKKVIVHHEKNVYRNYLKERLGLNECPSSQLKI